MILSKPFHYILDSEEQADNLIFSGSIDENSVFPEADKLQENALNINLDKVDMINSLGIRSWTRWMKKLTARIITLKKCTPAIVQQMNIVSGFLPSKTVIESFYVPFYCDHCDDESLELLERNKEFFPKTSETEARLEFDREMTCGNCGEQKQLDVLEGKYFTFIRNGQY